MQEVGSSVSENLICFVPGFNTHTEFPGRMCMRGMDGLLVCNWFLDVSSSVQESFSTEEDPHDQPSSETSSLLCVLGHGSL